MTINRANLGLGTIDIRRGEDVRRKVQVPALDISPRLNGRDGRVGWYTLQSID
jgi:hypothetical protein